MTETSYYEVTVQGVLGPAACAAFAPLRVDRSHTTTSISGGLTQEALHELLDRVRDLALELLEIRQIPPNDAAQRPGKHSTSG
jgi:hypothetical protein